MRTIFGLLAILLGLVGIAVAIGLGVAVWPVATKVSARTDTLATTANQHLDEVVPVLQSLEQIATTTESSVASIGAAANRVADGTVKEDPTLANQINEILRNFSPLVAQAESLGQTLQSFSVMLRSASQLQSTFGNTSDGDRMLAISNNLSAASKVLNRVNADFQALKSGEAVPQAEKIAELARLAGPPLAQLSGGLAEARAQTERVKEQVTDVQRTVQFWSIVGPPIVDAILVWFAAGQLCLVGWGRRTLRA